MKTNYIAVYAVLILLFSGCDKFLDRPPLTALDDNTNGWTSEEKLRMYADKYYADFFNGYGIAFNYGTAPMTSSTNTDDVVSLGNQANFTRSVPNSGIWSYTNIRSLNIMLDRIETRMSGILSEEAKAHWTAVGKFFRAFRYCELVQSYGDVPYYDFELFDTDLEELYKPRTARNEVMNHVYDDWLYVLENIRTNDGDDQKLNKYIAAGFISRLALTEASWQKYYYNNPGQAKKFYELAIEAAQIDISSGKYDIVTDYKSLFTSKDLKGNKDMVLYRGYDAALGVTHAIASQCNLSESTNNGPTTDLLKAYLCTDGKTWGNSAVANASEFDLTSMIQSRDPRFEATFFSKPNLLNRSALFYVTKYFSREAEESVVTGNGLPTEFSSNRNETDAPILRYSEVLLNWIEAKAELASMGGAAVTQDDINKSINKIRQRPVAAEAKSRGVENLPDLLLNALPTDPDRDPSVSPLLWEIRRERRLEFVFETNRLADLRRWSKLEYMDNEQNTDLLSGGWVDFPVELPNELDAKNIGVFAVVDKDGTETVYNGTNDAEMKGFYKHQNNNPRLPFLNQANINPYLTPVGLVQMDEYELKGYVLKQTEGWPQN
ncbi:RagB/SusD family nutrient uptake outer membrane protein [Sphingobacterium chuzhouense]|uniref:RagB/SusD family nutrient uptake outer membrane protein n=1 Tax=Sphingobacterium chuzhouense TaxID=1742264 RepID=A0ABR7XXY6_9SPHI|nr:RagB/SusD family nutrient uptake outer membrane protein [Sphingobacterium chuzhouense]MBD1423892.1 RagB/SusD family nutrient uptake outer membrane protein [Sphingobacterium chuzhouense]